MIKHFLRLIFVFILSSVIANTARSEQNINMETTGDSLIYSMMVQVNTDSIESYVQSLQDLGTRFMIAPNRKNVAQWINDKFQMVGMENVRIDSTLCSTSINFWNLHYDTTIWQYNVVATIPGIENPNDYYVLGAHYDDIVAPNGDPLIFAPGADDNASGVAALLEIARIMRFNNYYPKTNVEFVAFAAEELMYYGESGSQGYVLNAQAAEMNINLMINNDMIANTSGSDWKIRVSNYTGCEWLTQMTEYIAETFTQIQPVTSEPTFSGEGDCRYFYEQDFPCVYLMENDFNPFYHTEDDVTDNCEFDYCAEAIKISLGVLINADFPVTGTNDKSREPFVDVYPNPTTGTIILNSDENFLVNNPFYQIISLSGKTIESAKISSSEQSIYCLNDSPMGVYFVKIVTDDFLKTFKVIVRR